MARAATTARRGQKPSVVRFYGFIGLIVCFVLAILFSTAYILHRLREDALNAHFDLGAMYARTFEDHLTQSCLFVDRTLTVQIEEISSGTPPARLGASFKSSLRNMPFLRSLSLVDQQGVIVASSNPANNGQRLAGDALPTTIVHVLRPGAPWQGRDFADGHGLSDLSPITPDTLGFIPLFRSFEFNSRIYTLVATLNPDFFINYYRQILVHADDQVELLRYDGTPLLFTGVAGQLGAPARYRELIADLEERESGKYEDGQAGQPSRLVAYRASRLFPLVVVAQVDRDRALAEWEQEKRRLLLVVIPSLALIVIAALRVYRRQRRIQNELIEAERREQEKFTTTVFSTVAGAMLATDATARIVLVNPALTKATGFTAEELVGQTPSLFASGVHEPEFYRRMWDELKQGGFWQGELHNRRQDGRPWIAWTTISRICDDDGQVTHYVAGYSDITERKQMEESLRCAKEEAESSTRAKSEFLALMSHEIRTPMNGVICMTGLLLDTELDAEQRHYAEIVRKNGENLLVIINDILDFSKIEAHHLDLELTPFDLRSTLEEAIETLAPKAHDKGIEIVGLVDPALPRMVTGDPGRLRQVLLNLTGNAVKFTATGEITVRVELQASTDQELCVAFSVQDTGIGIPADRIGAIFEPFTQADGSTTRKFGGTGLGLAISKQLCRLMGGDIQVESSAGAGSTFRFTSRFQPVAAAAEPALDLAPLDEARILVVEDNRANRELLATLLTGWHCRHVCAADGATALDLLREARAAGDPFNIVLLDHQLPDMAGLSLAAAIRETPAAVVPTLVLLTPLGKRIDATTLHQSGLHTQLAKPLREQLLHDCLSLVMGRPTATGRTAPGRHVDRRSRTDSRRSAARILLAEDNPTNQTVAVALLKKLGYRADVVANGLEALEALSRVRYDLVFMDCQMLEMDGFEATKAIRNSASNVLDHGVPIIAMTANAMRGDNERCLKAGMNDYLSKPVDPRELERVLEQWLPTGTTAGAAALGTVPQESEQAGSPPAIFNVASLPQSLNDSAFIKEIVDIALEDIPAVIEQLALAMAAGDPARTRFYAHTLKGMAGNIRAEALYATVVLLEDALETGLTTEVAALLQQTQAQGATLLTALEQWRQAH